MNLSVSMRSASPSMYHLSFVVFALVLSLSLGTSCGPSKAGDSCDLTATEEPCPDGLECQNTATEDDGDGGRCLVSLGGSCAKEGNVDEIAELCADAGMVVEHAFDNWTARPLRRTSGEMLLVARRDH